jgi:hypothetical protein
MKIRQHGLAISLALALASATSNAQQTPICIDPPAINGTPGAATAPAGWSAPPTYSPPIAPNTPDIIAGNGPWPGFAGFTISNVTGPSPSGGTMGNFLGDPPVNSVTYVEFWSTTLTGLTPGQTYSVAVYWQQASGEDDPPNNDFAWSGGRLRMSVDGNPTDYTGVGTPATDTWQLAVKTFTATGTTAVFELGKTPENFFGMVVADTGNACAALGNSAVTQVPTASPIALGAMGAGLLLWALYGLRRRERKTS